MTSEHSATRITGHRGARGRWPENSLEGFRRVGRLGVDAIEFDVHRTDEGELLVLHDPWLERTTDGSGPVRRLTTQLRRQLRLRDSSETVPTLGEVLAVLDEVPAELHVELKNDELGTPYPGLAVDVLAEIDRHGMRSRCLLASFDVTVLEACRQAAPEVPRLVSVDAAWLERQGGPAAFIDRVDGLAEIVAVHHAVLREHWQLIVARLPRRRICVWTVNDPDDTVDWLARGVGYLTSDLPDQALRLRAEPASGLGAAT